MHQSPQGNDDGSFLERNAGQEPEQAVVDRAKAGDPDALGQLYDSYFPKIYRYMLARTGNPSEAEDLAAEVFVKMLNAISGFQWRKVPFASWLFRIAHNLVISHRRKNGIDKRGTPLTDSISSTIQDGHDPVTIVENKLVLEEIVRAIQFLSDAQRDVIALRFASGLSVAETAKALGKQEGNVKVLQHKAIARLQQILTTETANFQKAKAQENA